MSSSWQIQGVIQKRLGSQNGVNKQGKEWLRAECLVTVGENKTFKLSGFNDKAQKILDLAVGTPIVASGKMSCNEWEGKYYNNFELDMLDVTGAIQEQAPPKEYKPQPASTELSPVTANDVPGLDEVPF